MSKIAVNLDYLDGLADDLDSTCRKLRRERIKGARLQSDPETDDALDDFLNKWDKRRRELADNLESVADAVTKIRQSFADTDEKLAAELEG